MKETKVFNKTKAGLAIIIAIMSLSLPVIFSGWDMTAEADETFFVTVKWTIPGDYSLDFAYPAVAPSEWITFTTSGPNFNGTGATGQTAVVRAMNITNSGNAVLFIRGNFTSGGMPDNVTAFNLTGNYTTQNEFTWTIANNVTEQVICSGLGIGATVDFWAYTSGLHVEAQTATSKTFRIRSATS